MDMRPILQNYQILVIALREKRTEEGLQGLLLGT